jgi:hypothetical protein
MRFFDDEDDEMRTRTRNWKAALVAGAIAAGFGTAASAWDTGFNQPGAIGNHRLLR